MSKQHQAGWLSNLSLTKRLDLRDGNATLAADEVNNLGYPTRVCFRRLVIRIPGSTISELNHILSAFHAPSTQRHECRRGTNVGHVRIFVPLLPQPKQRIDHQFCIREPRHNPE